jgi:dipeptidyl aminopeptidase/acylaminoacyl peptidase
MTLPTGSRLGPYEILAPLGAGGMGEVYRARDPRLGREVAIKVLPASFSQDADRLRRFEQEARAAGILNHPNITAVYDIGTHEGAPYVVQELLEGETLRQELAGGRLSPRKAIEHAVQIASGLAAAHDKGIIHRDLKPENVFVTKDGRAKILDFGLAKLTLTEQGGSAVTNMPTATGATEPGVVLGTLGYMSPEQVKGKPADARSDIFAFGAILYEMLSGRRAFHADSAAETMSAILREDPPDLSVTNQNLPPGIDRILRHCLEKNPEQRFQSARDLAFDLGALSDVSAAGRLAPVAEAERPAARVRILTAVAAALVLALGTLAAGYFLGLSKGISPPTAFHQLTFRKGAIWEARLSSDGKSVLYSASWDGKPTEIYVSHPESPESRPFGVAATDLLAVSPSGELAVAVKADWDTAFTRAGTLARVGATGGTPRELLEGVQFADWSPDGKDLAVVREVKRRIRLEFPAGKVLYETAGWVGNPRFSPKGDAIAFLDHPVINDDGGSVAIVDLSGKKTTLSPVYASAAGLAWSPDGNEVWFTAAEVGGNRVLRATTRSGGRLRTLAGVPGILTLHDVSRDGRVLITQDLNRIGLVAGSIAEGETDLTWLDWSLMADLSRDGRTVLFSETGEGGGQGYSVYLRQVESAAAVRLGEGAGQAISADGRRVLAIDRPTTDQRLVSYPTGAGETKVLSPAGFHVRAAAWLPDGRIILVAAEAGHEMRTYILDEAGGKPRACLPEGYRGVALSGNEKQIAARGPEDRYYICSLDGGNPAPIPGITQSQDSIVGWAAGDRSLFVRRGTASSLPARVVRIDVDTGREEKWRDLLPTDAAGINGIVSVRVTPDGSRYAYSYYRDLSTLCLASGIK